MFVYLSKRIAIPNGTIIHSVGWNEEQGWLACGGTKGFLKVLKVDGGAAGQKTGGLSLNQTLEGHESTVTLVAWNQVYRKLTSSDESGKIIVWTLHKGMWFEEMVNNRNRSHVVALAWSNNGTKICISYADGAVIVGGVDGNRNWGRELKYTLARVCWSPDDKLILFGTATGEVFAHDATGGQYVSQANISCLDDGEAEKGTAKLAGIAWHPAWVERPEPLATLCICYTNGKMQLMESLSDDKPYLIDAGIPVSHISWNPQGTILAVSGVVSTPAPPQPSTSNTTDPTASATTPGSGPPPTNSIVVTQFFSNEGMHLRTLRVAGRVCGGVTWEGDGLRVAAAVDASVYFSNVRPDYKYCYFQDTAVYAFNRPDKVEDSVMLWNVRTNERCVKHIRGLLYLDAARDACAVVSRPNPVNAPQQTMVQLLTAIGSPIGTQFVDLEPYVFSMNSSCVVCCGEESVYLWQFRDPAVRVDDLDPISVQASRSATRQRIFHIDDIVRADTDPSMVVRSAMTNDLICAVCTSEEMLLIGRESGAIHMYTLDPVQLVGKVVLPSRAHALALNCDSTTFTVTDLGGLLRIYPLERERLSLVPRKAEPVSGSNERKDVWCARWAEDDPSGLVVMEKTRMYLFNGLEAEEPVQSCANICQFKDLRVRALQFDEIMLDAERPRKEYVSDFESRLLRECREVLATATVKEAYQYIDSLPSSKAGVAAVAAGGPTNNSSGAKSATATGAGGGVEHPRLWAMLAEHALGVLDFTHAEMAFIRGRDYPALQFVKRIRALDDERKQTAEVHTYYHRIDEAEDIYRRMDRKDLALELRHQLGDWFGVVRLVQEGGGDESMLLEAWQNIGDHYANHQKWTKASQYYTQCRQYAKLARVFYIIDDFDMLAQLIPLVEHDRTLLLTLGGMFLTVGLAEPAATAYLAAGEPRLAVDGCVSLNLWDRAIALAEQHRLDDVGQLLATYASYLITRDRLPEAIELYRKAGQHDEAARLLAKLGHRASETDALRAKKFYVLSALEVDRYRKRKIGLGRDGGEVVDELLTADRAAVGGSGGGGGGVSGRTLDTAWRGAEAFHFYLMCQRQLHERSPQTALVLAMRLMEYDDLIAPVDAYSLLALSGYLANNFGLCSRAFTRLEAAERNDELLAAAAGATSSTSEKGTAAGNAATLLMTAAASTNLSMDLDVTARTTASAAASAGGGGNASMGASSLSGTSALQLTNASKGVATAASAAAFTYATVSLAEPARRFSRLAIEIFSKHRPADTSIDSVPCGECGSFNKEWARACVKCAHPFDTCVVTGRSIPSTIESWSCPACRHKAIEAEADRFKNCPLCHTPKKQRNRRLV